MQRWRRQRTPWETLIMAHFWSWAIKRSIPSRSMLLTCANWEPHQNRCSRFPRWESTRSSCHPSQANRIPASVSMEMDTSFAWLRWVIRTIRQEDTCIDACTLLISCRPTGQDWLTASHVQETGASYLSDGTHVTIFTCVLKARIERTSGIDSRIG